MIEEKYDQVRRLINMGKERGYLLYDEATALMRWWISHNALQ